MEVSGLWWVVAGVDEGEEEEGDCDDEASGLYLPRA